jgi:signal transduction histidine kinase
VARQTALTAMDEWTALHYRRIRGLRMAVLGVGLVTGLVVALVDPLEMLTQSALLVALAVSALGTGVTFLPGFKHAEPVTLTVMALLDLLAIGMLAMIPELQMLGTVLVLMPAMWLGGTLGRKGIAVAAVASAMLVVAPHVLMKGGPADGWSHSVSAILFATLSATGIALTIEMWNSNVRTLEQQGDELRSAISVKDEFIALVSHELRTPLTSIIGYLDLVIDGDEAIPDEALHHLAAVSRNADRLLLLVTDLLSAHQAESVPMRLVMERVDVAALAKLSLDDADQRATEAGLTIVRDLPPGIVITADPNRLLQILDNLMSNAIKFTPPGGHISVTVRRQTLPGQGPGVDLMVTDTGVGIDEISLQHVGKKFFRSPMTTSAAVPGIGLGLMITKAIIEAHHGSLTITSAEGEGTSVLVHLPCGTTAMPDTREPGQARPKADSRDRS